MDLDKMKQSTTRMILQLAVPSIIGMVLTSFITIADGFFIGNYVGKEGIAAVNLGLPVIYLFLGIGLMVSVGGVAIAGMAFGAGDKEKCNKIFRQTIATTAGGAILTGLLVFLFFGPMLDLLGADGLVRDYFCTYYIILIPELVVMVVNSSLGMFIRGEGKPQFYMKVNIVGVVMNIVLDYLLAGVLHTGIAGIAAASLISALVSLAAILYFFYKRAQVYRFGKLSFSISVLKSTLLNGSSEFIGEMSTGIAMFAYNFVIMRRIGVDGVSAFTIVGYVAYMFSMVVIGFGQGASPLFSFSYGAQEKALAGKIRQKTNGLVFIMGVLTFLLITAFSGWYGELFVKNTAVQEMVKSGISVFMVSFFFSGINAITSFYFTSTGRAFESAVISSARGLVILLICIFVLPVYFGMTGVWLAAPVTEGITFGISIFYIKREMKISLL